MFMPQRFQQQDMGQRPGAQRLSQLFMGGGLQQLFPHMRPQAQARLSDLFARWQGMGQ